MAQRHRGEDGPQAQYRKSVYRFIEERAGEIGRAELQILRAIIEAKGPCCPTRSLLMSGAVGTDQAHAQEAMDRLTASNWVVSWVAGTDAFEKLGWSDHSTTLTVLGAERLGLELVEPEEESLFAKARWGYVGDDPADFWQRFGRHCCESPTTRMRQTFGAGPLDRLIEEELGRQKAAIAYKRWVNRQRKRPT